jgi:hypothetical protein
VNKLVIIISVLFITIISTGPAAAETLTADDETNRWSEPFAIAQDDGGALAEKATVRSMRKAADLNAEETWSAKGRFPTTGPALTASLVAIREEEI